MKRLLFIYNPHAGKELLKPKLADVIDIFVKAGYEVVAYPTQAYRDAYKKIKKYDSNEYDLVVCSGGDGTLDEVVTGMMKRDRDKRDPIGYIPTGTTNDFASSLHIPRGLLEAADNAVNGEVFSCDAGRFNDDIFVYRGIWTFYGCIVPDQTVNEKCIGTFGVCSGRGEASVQHSFLQSESNT